MKKTVFISSTYRDLVNHRQRVLNALQNYDIVIRGMEGFGARENPPLETCLEEIDKSDIYVGIISMCYGSVDNNTGKSYTQLEYEKAKELGLDIMIYLIDENKGKVDTGHIDFGEQNLRLKDFKNVLKNNHTVDWFVDEEDLSRKIYNRLGKLVINKTIVKERPKSLKARIFRIILGERKWGIFVSYFNGMPFEIFSTLMDTEDGVLIPSWVDEGVIKRVLKENGIPRFDFQFINKRGYKTTIEAISHPFHPQISAYDRIINELLKGGNLIEAMKVLNHMDVRENEFSGWKEEVSSIITI